MGKAPRRHNSSGWTSPNNALCGFPPAAAVVRLRFYCYLLCGRERCRCCHCQSLADGTMDPDTWKRQIHSDIRIWSVSILAWADYVLGMCLLHWRWVQSWKMSESTKNMQQQTCLLFSSIILQNTNSISMFLEALWCQSGTFFQIFPIFPSIISSGVVLGGNGFNVFKHSGTWNFISKL